ncbi:MAG: cytochrome c family protein [Gammaproteobacteria bacterium]
MKYATLGRIVNASLARCFAAVVAVGLGGCGAEDAQPPLSAAAEHGKQIFNQCRACHAVKRATGHLVGPNLSSVYGSQAGRNDGYAYSTSMKESGIVWTDDALDTYLTRPSEYVPGTKMTFGGLSRAEDRAGIIAYLKAASRQNL